jgi:hypothetical protein
VGEISRAYAKAASDDVISDIDDAIFDRLKELNPQSEWVASGVDGDRPPVQDPKIFERMIATASVKEALSAAPRGASPGPSGWRVEHLLQCRMVDQGDIDSVRFHNTLRQTLLLLIQEDNGLPAVARDLLFGGSLVALRKPSGGIRPIVMGDVLLRLLAKALSVEHGGSFRDFLAPLGQLGVAISAGAESIVHATRVALQSHPDWVVLQLDFENAFQRISRELILQELSAHFPMLVPYFLMRYGRPTVLQMTGDRRIYSSSGVQQGDPLGPFFFAVGLAAVLREAYQGSTTEGDLVSQCLRLFYMDDGVLCGPAASVGEAVNRLLAAATRLGAGLSANASKTVVWSPSRSPEGCRTELEQYVDPIALNMADVNAASEGFILLGAPIGTAAFEREALLSKVVNLKIALNRIRGIVSTQIKIILLRHAAVPQFSYAIRTAAPSSSLNAARQHDDAILEAFATYQGFASSKTEWQQLISLPKRLGGVGLLSATELAPIAYVSSVAASYNCFAANPGPFKPIQDLLDAWIGRQASDPTVSPDVPSAPELANILFTFRSNLMEARLTDPSLAEGIIDDATALPPRPSDLPACSSKLQQRMSKVLYEMKQTRLMASVSEGTKAHILSNQQRGAGAIYDAIPSTAELTLSNEVFEFFSRRRQCIADFEATDTTCTCNVGRVQSSTITASSRPVSVYHEELCPLGGGTTDRHDTAAYAIAAMLRAAGHNTHVQVQQQGSLRKQPDIVVMDFPENGKNAFVEVSVTCPSATSTVRQAAQHPLHAATVREKEKIGKYAPLAAQERFTVFPAVFESFGAMGKGLQSIVSICAAKAVQCHVAQSTLGRTWASQSFHQYWTQVIAVAYWRGAYQMDRARQQRMSSQIEEVVVPRHRAVVAFSEEPILY